MGGYRFARVDVGLVADEDGNELRCAACGSYVEGGLAQFVSAQVVGAEGEEDARALDAADAAGAEEGRVFSQLIALNREAGLKMALLLLSGRPLRRG